MPTVAVGPAVGQGGLQSIEDCRIWSATVARHQSRNPTHYRFLVIKFICDQEGSAAQILEDSFRKSLSCSPKGSAYNTKSPKSSEVRA